MDIHRIGRYIAMKRREAGMTQAELSQRLHVTRQAVSKWESGKSIPDTATLLSLSNLFDLTVEELLNGGDLPTPAAGEPSLPPTMVPGVPSPSCSPSEPAAYDFGGQPPCPGPVPARPAIRHPAGWLLWVPALLVTAVAAGIPLARAFLYSFTSCNRIEVPRFIGLENYAALLREPLMRQATLDTLLMLVGAGGTALLLGWILGSAAARLPRPVGIVTGALLAVGSLSVLFPAWVQYLFSSEASGWLNALLMERGLIDAPILWTRFSNEIQLLLLFLLCLAPAYLIFYTGGRLGRRRAAWHVAVTAVPMLLLAGWMIPTSDGYFTHWLPVMIFQYGAIRLEVGRACALLMVCLLLTALLIAVGHLLVWGTAALSRNRRAPSPSLRPRHWCGGAAGLLCGLLLQFPLLLIIGSALRPADDFFLYPPRLLPTELTADNLTRAWEALPAHAGLDRLPLYILLALAGYVLLALPTAAALLFLRGRGKRVTAAIWFASTALLPFSLLSFNWEAGVTSSRLLSSLLAYIASPLLPVSVLLTVWILQKSTAGCSTFSLWIRRPRRVAFTTAALLATGLASTLSLLFATQPLLYDDAAAFPLELLARQPCGASLLFAAYTLLIGAGILLLLPAALLPALSRVSRPKSAEKGEGSPPQP